MLEEGTRPTCVITDLGMPGIDGRELVARIRRAHPDLVVAVVSGWPFEKVSALFADTERPDFILEKPLTWAELQQVFAKLQNYVS